MRGPGDESERAAAGANEPAGTKQGVRDIQAPHFHDDVTCVSPMSPPCPRRGRCVWSHQRVTARHRTGRAQSDARQGMGTRCVSHCLFAASLVRVPGVSKGKRRVQRYSCTARCHWGWWGLALGVLPARSFSYPPPLCCSSQG